MGRAMGLWGASTVPVEGTTPAKSPRRLRARGSQGERGGGEAGGEQWGGTKQGDEGSGAAELGHQRPADCGDRVHLLCRRWDVISPEHQGVAQVTVLYARSPSCHAHPDCGWGEVEARGPFKCHLNSPRKKRQR